MASIRLLATLWGAIIAAGMATVYGWSLVVDGTANAFWLLGVFIVATSAAGCLMAGAWIWYGRLATQLRLAGFVLALLAAVATYSFAWLLVPALLPSALGLSTAPVKLQGGGRRGKTAAKIG